MLESVKKHIKIGYVGGALDWIAKEVDRSTGLYHPKYEFINMPNSNNSAFVGRMSRLEAILEGQLNAKPS